MNVSGLTSPVLQLSGGKLGLICIRCRLGEPCVFVAQTRLLTVHKLSAGDCVVAHAPDQKQSFGCWPVKNASRTPYFIRVIGEEVACLKERC